MLILNVLSLNVIKIAKKLLSLSFDQQLWSFLHLYQSEDQHQLEYLKASAYRVG